MKTTIADRRRAGDLDGWEQGKPPRVGLIDGAAVDEQTAREATCQSCGKVGMVAYPYRRTNGEPGYRCFAVCLNCDHSEEF